MLVVADFVGYWMHRLFHTRALWRVHAIHHSSRQLDWLAAARAHPLNYVLTDMAQVVPFFFLGFNPLVVASILPFLNLWAIFLHANVRFEFGPLKYVFATPLFHRWHHTSEEAGLDKNFAGLFPVWDMLFGTFYLPKGRKPQVFGIVNHEVPESLLSQLAYPFKRPVRA